MTISRFRRAAVIKLLWSLALMSVTALSAAGCKSKDSAQAEKGSTAGGTVRFTGPPRLILGRHFIDAGPVRPESTHERSITVQNAGGEELLIERTQTACTCFQASFDRMRLGPGESGQMKVNFDTLQHRGEVREMIGIVSNDPAGVKTLSMRFEVPYDIAASPDQVHLGIVRPGQEVRRRIQVVANADVQTKVLYALSDSEALVGKVISPALSRQEAAVVEVVMTAPAGAGTYGHALVITTAYQKQPTVRLPVVVSVSESASVSLGSVDFGRFARGDAVVRQISLRAGPGTRLQFAAAQPEVLDVKVGPADAEGTVKLELAPLREAPYGPLNGELHLEIEGKESCTLSVPFAGYVADELDRQPGG